MEYNVSNANNYMYLHKPDGSILMGFNTTVWTSGHQLKFNIYGPDGSVAHQAVWSRNVYYSDSTANFDYCFDLANDEIKIYLNENLQATISAPLKENWSGSEASYLRFYILRYGALTFSQMVVADEKTVGWRVKTLTPDSAGTYQEYSGDVSDINSIALSSETANSTDTHGAKQTYQYTDVQSEIQTDMKVAAVAVETVGNSIGTLSSLSNIVIVDGEEYKLPNTTDVQSNNFGTGIVDQMDVNPRTGLAWTFDEVNSLEFGFTVEDLT
ncbi:hypothetical protein BCS93_11070 [Vibrio breoganii]|uniref:Uncharacterized protein n=2 Tax=Vibrio breoganii TaxID=553239 RepID=A0AAP8SWH4_9VIBR|nr:hypothetical protein BCS93_11070 [Vibrio breoganii]